MSNMPELAKKNWKSLIIIAMILLAFAGVVTALFNLPVVSGDVPR